MTRLDRLTSEVRELLTYIDRQMGYHHEPEAPGRNPDWRLPYATDTIVIVTCDACGYSARVASTIALVGVPCAMCEAAMLVRRDRNAARVRLTPYTIAREGQATIHEDVMG